MAEATIGERLAEARRIKGETIEEVSDRLRIRPSILLAIETSNFSHMPHKGYAHNMVSSYARYLGLNSVQATEQFLREFNNWERTSKGAGGYGNANSLQLASRRAGTASDEMPGSLYLGQERETITAAKRNRNRSSVWGEEDMRDVDRKFRTQLKQVQEDKGYRQSAGLRRTQPRRSDNEVISRQLRSSNDYVGKPPRKSIFSGFASNLTSKPVLIVIGLIVVFLAILILWAILASTCAKNDTANTPVIGAISSDEGLEEGVGTNASDIEQGLTEDDKYGPFELTVEVVDGESWLQIDIDGTTPVGEVCQAGWSASYTVSSSCLVQAGAPGFVKVYRNGTEVPLDTAGGTGIAELLVEQRPIVQNAQDADTASQE